MRVLANNNDSDELAKYDGYAKAYYEHLVEAQTYIAGKYTNNVDYVKSYIDQTKENASAYYDRWTALGDNSQYSKSEILQNIAAEVIGGIATIPDVLSSLLFWKDEDEKSSTVILDYPYFTCEFNCKQILIKSPYQIKLSKPIGSYNNTIINSGERVTFATSSRYFSVESNASGYGLTTHYFDTEKDMKDFADSNGNHAFNVMVSLLAKKGVTVSIYDGTHEVPAKTLTPNTSVNDIREYVESGEVPSKIPDSYIPDIKPTISCPSSTYDLTFVDGVFKKGSTVVNVEYSGKAIFDNETCTLKFEKPIIDYDDKNNVIVDGKDIEKEPDKPKVECDSVLCFLAQIIDSITEFASTIVTGILEGIGDVIKFLFVPSENFWSDNLNQIENLMFGEQIDQLILAVEEMQNVSSGNVVASTNNVRTTSNVFQDVVVDLMGLENLTIIDASVVNSVLDNIHSWVRGVFYALLVLFNVNQLYKMIRGTSMLEGSRRGEGGKTSDN